MFISFALAANETDQTEHPRDNCVLIYNFILEHYNGTLNYLSYEFYDLENETNLTTAELKDYLINYESKCYLILPYENYTVKTEEEIEPETKEEVRSFIRSMFNDPQSFLMTISIVILAILIIRMTLEK